MPPEDASMRSTPSGFDLAGEGDGVFDGPAALGPVGGGDAEPEGQALGPDVADGCDDLAQEAGAVVEAAAVVVGAGVDQRREKLVDQVAVGGVDFDQFEAGLEGAAGGFGKGVDDGGDAFGGERFGLDGFRGERLGGGGVDGTPAAFGDGHGRAVLAPGHGGGGLEAGVGELGSGDGAVVAKKADDAREVLDVRVLPDAEVGGTDAAFGEHGVGFGEDRAGSADGAGAEMDEMPVVGEAVFAGVLAHGGDGDAITEGDIADLKRVEQVHRGWMIAGEVRGQEQCCAGMVKMGGRGLPLTLRAKSSTSPGFRIGFLSYLRLRDGCRLSCPGQ